MSHLKQNIKNSVYNVADVIVYPLAFFVTIPFFMKHLGADLFGLWMLMNTLIITFQILNLGLGPAIVKFTALHKTTHDQPEQSNILSAGISFSVILACISILAGLIISYLTNKGVFFDLPQNLRSTGAAAIMITAFIIGSKFTEQILLHTFKGIERFDLYFFINNFIKFLTLIINIIQVYYFQSLTAMLAVSLCVTILMIAFQIWLLYKMIPGFEFKWQVKTSSAKKLLQFGFFIWIQSIIIIIVFQLDRYFVVSFWGPAELGYYALVSTIFVNIHSCISATATWLIPRLVAQNPGSEKQKSMYLNLRAFVTITGITILGIFYLLYQPLFSIWIGTEKLKHIESYINLFTAFEFFYLLLVVPPIFMNYSGFIQKGTMIIYFFSVLNIFGIICGFLYQQNGNGLIMGLLVSTAVSLPFVYYFVNRILFRKVFLYELAFFLVLPLIACMMIYLEGVEQKVTVFIIVLLLCWLYFIKFERNKIMHLFR